MSSLPAMLPFSLSPVITGRRAGGFTVVPHAYAGDKKLLISGRRLQTSAYQWVQRGRGPPLTSRSRTRRLTPGPKSSRWEAYRYRSECLQTLSPVQIDKTFRVSTLMGIGTGKWACIPRVVCVCRLLDTQGKAAIGCLLDREAPMSRLIDRDWEGPTRSWTIWSRRLTADSRYNIIDQRLRPHLARFNHSRLQGATGSPGKISQESLRHINLSAQTATCSASVRLSRSRESVDADRLLQPRNYSTVGRQKSSKFLSVMGCIVDAKILRRMKTAVKIKCHA